MKTKMLTCDICGAEFVPSIKLHYISSDLRKTGLAATFGSTDEPSQYDTFDCPNCGCQVVAKTRKRIAYPLDEVSEVEILDSMDNETIADYLGLDPEVIEELRGDMSDDDEDTNGGIDTVFGFNPYI